MHLEISKAGNETSFSIFYVAAGRLSKGRRWRQERHEERAQEGKPTGPGRLCLIAGG